ncbi:MAG: cytochrome c3 family protein [Nitrospiraceae bacterium]|nr:cytochrome c3 family protein [Nitrospiraceae bacterium]
MSKFQRYGFLYMTVLAFFSLLPLTAGGRAVLAAGKSGCVTGKCHSRMGKGKYVHGPVAVEGCVFCHQPAGPHRFKPIPENISDLCYQCHERMETMEPLHPPVETSRCTACHSPHQSPHKYQLRGAGAHLWLPVLAIQPLDAATPAAGLYAPKGAGGDGWRRR